MNPLEKFEDNPGFERAEEHGDLWAAISKCYTRIAVVDERIRAALVWGLLPVAGFIVALLITLLGLLVAHNLAH